MNARVQLWAQKNEWGNGMRATLVTVQFLNDGESFGGAPQATVAGFEAVEDEAGELREADAAELRLIDEMRRMGQEALQAWASGQVEKTSQEICQEGGVWSEGKKNCTGIPPLATSR